MAKDGERAPKREKRERREKREKREKPAAAAAPAEEKQKPTVWHRRKRRKRAPREGEDEPAEVPRAPRPQPKRRERREVPNAARVSLKEQGLTELEKDAAPASCTRLDLAGNRLAKIGAAFASLKELTWLNLAGNALKSLDGLRPLRRLVFLNVSDNQLKKLDGAFRLTHLKALVAVGNSVAALPAPEDMQRCAGTLETLVVSGNLLREANVSALTKLTKLSLSQNQLTSLPEGLEACERLSELRLNGNRIAGVPASLGESCQRLKLLDLGKNALSSVDGLDALKGLPHLRNLNLRGNEALGEVDQYRKPVLELLPLLQIIDSKPVDERRKKRARGSGDAAAAAPKGGNAKLDQKAKRERKEKRAAAAAKAKAAASHADEDEGDDDAVDFAAFQKEAAKRQKARDMQAEAVAAVAAAQQQQQDAAGEDKKKKTGIVKVIVKKRKAPAEAFDPSKIGGDTGDAAFGSGW